MYFILLLYDYLNISFIINRLYSYNLIQLNYGDDMKRKIPVKNYIYLGILFFITTLLTISLSKLYLNNNSLNSSKFLPEVSVNELSNYAQENPNIIVYLSYSKDNKKIDKKIEKYLIKNDINKGIIYINLDNVTDSDINMINNNYLSIDFKNSGKSVKKHNNLLIINDSLIVDNLYDEEIEMKYSEVIDFIEKHEVFK